MDTAEYMLSGGRYFYAVLMCHLSIEKALKGFYQDRLSVMLPKTHNLIYLLNKAGIKPPESIGRFVVKLNEASVMTRYPEDIDKLEKDYTQTIVRDMIAKNKEVLAWINAQF